MLDDIILLIGPAAVGQDDLIELLIKQAKSFLIMYCNLDEYDKKFDSIVIKMVIEDWNKRGSEGITSKSFNGISESYSEEPYSSIIMTALKKMKRNGIKFL